MDNHPLKVSLIIPIHNEQDGLAYILPQLNSFPIISDIVIVDDASTDNSVSIACEFDKVKILTRPALMGLGSAIRAGLTLADSQFIAVMDGDGQHNPTAVKHLISDFENNSSKFTIYIGSRFLDKNDGLEGLSLPRKLVSIILTKVIKNIGGVTKSTDPLTGMFLCHRQYINGTTTKGYKILLQILLRNKTSPVYEIPIVLESRIGGKSKANIKELFRVFKLCITK